MTLLVQHACIDSNNDPNPNPNANPNNEKIQTSLNLTLILPPDARAQERYGA